MRPQTSSSSSTDSSSLSSSPNNFLNQSSLLTALPPAIHGTDAKTSDQKTVSPIKLTLAQLDSHGKIRINITVPNSALTLGKLLGEGGFGGGLSRTL